MRIASQILANSSHILALSLHNDDNAHAHGDQNHGHDYHGQDYHDHDYHHYHHMLLIPAAITLLNLMMKIEEKISGESFLSGDIPNRTNISNTVEDSLHVTPPLKTNSTVLRFFQDTCFPITLMTRVNEWQIVHALRFSGNLAPKFSFPTRNFIQVQYFSDPPFYPR